MLMLILNSFTVLSTVVKLKCAHSKTELKFHLERIQIFNFLTYLDKEAVHVSFYECHNQIFSRYETECWNNIIIPSPESLNFNSLIYPEGKQNGDVPIKFLLSEHLEQFYGSLLVLSKFYDLYQIIKRMATMSAIFQITPLFSFPSVGKQIQQYCAYFITKAYI